MGYKDKLPRLPGATISNSKSSFDGQNECDSGPRNPSQSVAENIQIGKRAKADAKFKT